MPFGPPQTYAVVSRDCTNATVSETVSPGAISPVDEHRIRRAGEFLYVDCGRFGGDFRHFAVIYGNPDEGFGYVALCDFNSGLREAQLRTIMDHRFPITRRTETVVNLRDFIIHCGGTIMGEGSDFKCYDLEGIDTRNEEGQPMMYVLLGDLHLPLLHRSTFQSLDDAYRRVPERFSAADFIEESVSDDLWLRLYFDADIFENAANDLDQFISRLESWRRTPIYLIQVGDMYELWIGLNCLFRDVSEHRVVLREEEDNLRIIRDWVCNFVDASIQVGQEGALQSLTRRLHNCHVDSQKWLLGNHDNYLRVLTAPEHRRDTDPPRRFMNFWNNGIHIEHGHQADTSFNRDGETQGWHLTQIAFVQRRVRDLESFFSEAMHRLGLGSRRDTFLEYAAKKYCEHRQDSPRMTVFGMAHTHDPYLTRFSVYVG